LESATRNQFAAVDKSTDRAMCSGSEYLYTVIVVTVSENIALRVDEAVIQITAFVVETRVKAATEWMRFVSL
jgi:phage-related tail fiber protein